MLLHTLTMLECVHQWHEQDEEGTAPAAMPSDSAALLAALASQHGIGYWRYDRKEGLTLSDEAKRNFSTDPALRPETLKNVFDALMREDRKQLKNKLRQALRDHAPFSICLKLRCKTHCHGDCAVKLSVHVNAADGKVTGFWGFAEDVTPRSRDKRSLQLLAEREARLMDAIRHMPDAFALFDEESRLIFWNKSYETVYPLAAPSYRVGEKLENILRFAVANGQYPEAIGREEEWLAERMEIHRKGDNAPVVQQLENGRWAQVNETKLPDGGYAGYRIDITERKNLENSLKAALYETRAAGQLQDSMLPNLAHELRTPLNAIIGFSQLIDMNLEDSEANAKPKEHARDILNAGSHLLSVLDGLFEVATVEAAHGDDDISKVDLADVISKACRLGGYQARQERKNLILEGSLSALVMGNETKLVQVVLNLLSNAIKYSGNGERIWISIKECDHDFVMLSVRDEGPGIPADQHKRLFERYERPGAENTGMSGSGLGLAIVKEFVESMNGRIGVKDAPGGGALFWVELPRAISQQKPRTPRSPKSLAG